MKNLGILFLASVVLSITLHAAPDPRAEAQIDYEREVGAIVRNKFFYKKGRFEAGITGGVMPYDSLVNHYMVGGKLTWHLHDHFGWEIIDIQKAFPSVTSFASGLVQDRGISNLQTTQLNYSLTTNLLLSPFYGKIRFFGSQVLFFDIYLALGGGMASTETIRLASTGIGVAGTQTSIRSGMEPCFDFGLGFKIFTNNFLGLVLDLRDYVVFSETYGKKNPKSNFSVFLGLSMFIPTF